MVELGDEVMTTSQVREFAQVKDALVWCRHRGISPLPLHTAAGERVWFEREIREGRRVDELRQRFGGWPAEYADAMTTDQVRELFGYAYGESARRVCQQHGIEPFALRSEANEKLWPGEQVRQLQQHRTGQGVRSDLGYTTTQGARKRGDALDDRDREVLAYLVAREQRGESNRAFVVAATRSPGAGESHPTRLAQLERRGMVKRSWRRDSDGRERRVARLTTHGRAVFADDARERGAADE